MKSRYTPTDAVKMFLLALITTQIVTIILSITCSLIAKSMSITFSELLSSTSAVVTIGIISSLSFLIAYLILHINNKVKPLKALKINFKISLSQVIILFLISIIGILGFTQFSNLTNYFLENIGYSVSSDLSISLDSFNNLLICLLIYALIPAICEEIVFRGVCYNGLTMIGSGTAIVISALMFAFSHLSLQQFVYQFFLGVVFALVIKYTGNLILTMILHFFNNAIVLIVGYLTYNPDTVITETIYDTPLKILMPILYAIIAMVIILLLIKGLKSITNYDNFDVMDLNQEKNEEKVLKAYQKDQDTFSKFAWLSFIIGLLLWVASISLNFQ